MNADESTTDGKISLPDKNGYSGKEDKSFKQEFFETRYELLSKAFEKMNLCMTDYVSEKELLQLLDSRCAYKFDRNIAIGLLSKIPKQVDLQILNQSIIEIQEFVHTFIKAEYLFLIKADEIDQKLNRIAKQKLALRQQLRACNTRNNEANTGTIPVENNEYYNLNLEILEVISEDFDRKYSPNARYTAVVKYDGYKYETMEAANDGLEFNPRFSHNFHLKLYNLRDKITLAFRKYSGCKNAVTFDESLAIFGFEVDFVNESRVEMWVDLYDQNHLSTQEKLLIAFQLQEANFIGMQYLNSQMQKFRQLEKELLSQERLISSSLNDLLEPFSARMRANRF